MNVTESKWPAFETPRHARTPAAVATSLVLHIAAAAAAVSLVQSAASAPRQTPPASRFIFLQPLAPVRLDLPPITLHVPREALAQRVRPEPATNVLNALVAPETRHAAEPSPPLPLAPEPAPKAAPTSAAVPAVTIGAFDRASPPARPAETVHEARSTGFDAPAARAADNRIAAATVGAFDRAAAASGPQPGSDRPAQVTSAGFGSAAASSALSAPARTVSDAGFGTAAARERAAQAPPKTIADSGFDAKATAETPASRPSKSDRIDVPLEILFKPAPEYTEEARALKIEGEVLLEIEFAASSDVRVLRVVRGLGHGLDEAAVHAAERIRFKPAHTRGRPVDFRTTVHIVFRLI